MSSKRKHDDAEPARAQKKSRKLDRKLTAEKEAMAPSLRKLPPLLQGAFRNLFYDSIRWLQPKVFESAMEEITSRLFRENPSYMHLFMVTSPCVFTRNAIVAGIIRILQEILMAKRQRLMFRAPDGYDPVNGVLATCRKEIETHVRKWCQELQNTKKNNIVEEGEGIRCTFRPILIIEIPDAQMYTTRDLGFYLTVVKETIIKTGVGESNIIILINHELHSDRIQSLSDEFNPSGPIVKEVADEPDSEDEAPPSPNDQDDDRKSEPASETDEDEIDEDEIYKNFWGEDPEPPEDPQVQRQLKDEWRFLQARHKIEEVHAGRSMFPCIILPFPAMRQRTRSYDYRLRFQDNIEHTLQRLIPNKVVSIEVPFYVGFVMAELYPTSNTAALTLYAKFLESVASRLDATAADVQDRQSDLRSLNLVDSCKVNISKAHTMTIKLSCSKDPKAGQAKIVLDLPQLWHFDRSVVSSMQEKIDEVKRAKNFEISDACKQGISENVGVIARNAPNADTLAVAELEKFVLPGGMVTFNPSICVVSQQSISGPRVLDWSYAIASTFARQQQEIQALKDRQDRMERENKERQDRLECQVQEIKQHQANMIGGDRFRTEGPPPGKGGIYTKFRSGSFAGYSIQYYTRGRLQCDFVSKRDLPGNDPEAKRAVLRARASIFGLTEDAIEKSFVRLNL